MARTVIPVTSIVRAGVLKPAVTPGDATNDHQFTNNGRTFIEAKNTDTVTRDLIFQTPLVTDGLALADLTISIPTGETWMIGPFATQTFNQTGDVIWLDIAQTTWEFRAFKL